MGIDGASITIEGDTRFVNNGEIGFHDAGFHETRLTEGGKAL